MSKQEEVFFILQDVRLGELSEYEAQLKLQELGVVIKAGCPHCSWSQFTNEVVGMTPCFYCNSTGYTFEPLIEG